MSHNDQTFQRRGDIKSSVKKKRRGARSRGGGNEKFPLSLDFLNNWWKLSAGCRFRSSNLGKEKVNLHGWRDFALGK